MRLPLWKKYLSYLYPMVLETGSTEFNPDIQIILYRKRLQLATPRAVYSYEDLYTNFTRAFKMLDWAKLPQREALLLGFGLGSVAYILDKMHPGEWKFTAVEIDPLIIEWASHYTLDKTQSQMEMVCADAWSFVMSQQQQYPVIIMDVFEDDFIPKKMKSTEFLEKLKSLISPGGLLMFNCLSMTPKDKTGSQSFFDSKFMNVFPQAALLDVKGNYILVSNKYFLRDTNSSKQSKA